MEQIVSSLLIKFHIILKFAFKKIPQKFVCKKETFLIPSYIVILDLPLNFGGK